MIAAFSFILGSLRSDNYGWDNNGWDNCGWAGHTLRITKEPPRPRTERVVRYVGSARTENSRAAASAGEREQIKLKR